VTTTPFWIVGIESFMPDAGKLNLLILIGITLGLAGVFLIFGSNFEELFDPSYLAGVLSILGAVVAWSAGSVYSNYKKLSLSPLVNLEVQMLIVGFIGVILDSISLHPLRIHFSHQCSLVLGYLIIFCSLIE